MWPSMNKPMRKCGPGVCVPKLPVGMARLIGVLGDKTTERPWPSEAGASGAQSTQMRLSSSLPPRFTFAHVRHEMRPSPLTISLLGWWNFINEIQVDIVFNWWIYLVIKENLHFIFITLIFWNFLELMGLNI